MPKRKGTGKSCLLAGCSYREVNPKDCVVLCRILKSLQILPFRMEKRMSQDISALWNGGQCSDLQASTKKDQISMRAQGYKLTQLKDGAQSAEVPFLLFHLSSVLCHEDVLADSVLWQPAPLHGVKSLSKHCWLWLGFTWRFWILRDFWSPKWIY